MPRTPKDTTLPVTEHGQATFERHTFGNPVEPRFNEVGGKTTQITVPENQDLTLYELVGRDGLPAVYSADYSATGNQPYGIMAAAVATAAGQTMKAPVYRDGSWSQGALVFDSSFDTDAKKQAAFEGSASPTIFIEKRTYVDASIDV